MDRIVDKIIDETLKTAANLMARAIQERLQNPDLLEEEEEEEEEESRNGGGGGVDDERLRNFHNRQMRIENSIQHLDFMLMQLTQYHNSVIR